MKTLRSLVLGLVILSSVFGSRSSQAAVGAIFAPSLVVAGLVMTATGVVSFPFAMSCAGGHGGCPSSFAKAGLIGFLFVLPAGLIVLEGEQSVAFSALTNEQARKLGLTKNELNHYNTELDQINILVGFVDQEIERSGDHSLENSAAIWTSVKDSLSPEAFSALGKISANIK